MGGRGFAGRRTKAAGEGHADAIVVGSWRDGPAGFRGFGAPVLLSLAAGFLLLLAVAASSASAGYRAELMASNVRCLGKPVALGSKVFFAGDNGDHGCEPWISDGTPAGTGMIKDIRTGTESSKPGSGYFSHTGIQPTAVANTVLFSARDDYRGVELWKSDGTAAGTALVKDLTPDDPEWPNRESDTSFLGAEVLAGKLLFVTVDSCSYALWRSDGTGPGTVKVTDLPVGVYGLHRAGANLFFGDYFGICSGRGESLWATDGAASGTRALREFPGYTDNYWNAPEELTDVAGTLFFRAGSSQAGHELWKSNGTSAGTVQVADIRPGAHSSSPKQLTAAGSTLFFVANDATHGAELWKSDGTPGGTRLVRDLRPGPHDADIKWLTALGNKVYFAASDGSQGGLWASDGTAQGTALLLEGGSPSDLAVADGSLFFNRGGLWSSDGTAAGTEPVLDQAGEKVHQGFYPVAAGGAVFFNSVSQPYDFAPTGNLWKATRAPPSPGDPFAELPPNDLAFHCDRRKIAIQFLEKKGRSARAQGFAASALIGEKVLLATVGNAKGKAKRRTSQTVIGPDGSFSGKVGLPKGKAALRKVSVVAKAGPERSRNVKLVRLARISRARSASGRTTLWGKVQAAKAKRPPVLTVRRRVACKGQKQWVNVAAGKQKRNGAFKVSFDNPAGTVGSVFQVKTRYTKRPGTKAKRSIVTWAVAVDLG